MTQKNKNNTNTVANGRLPWDSLPGDRLRQWSILILLALLSLLLIVLIELTPKVEKDRFAEQEVPDRLAKLVLERKKEIPPPPPEPEVEPEPEPEPEEKPKEEPKEEPKPKEVAKAREKAKKELKVFEDSLSGLRDLAPVLNNRNLRKGGSEAAKIDNSRNMITSRAGTGSGGISSASVSSSGGGGGNLAVGEIAQVESSINQEAATVRTSAQGKSVRTDEQIRIVLDRYVGKFNSAYQRGLRSNPAMQGTVVLWLEVAPDGTVTNVSIKSSELGDPDLERKIVLIASLMDFGALPVEVWKGNMPLNFFPR
ncbi:MAG: TonB family protein [Gammaproteobacteria bacterium]|nr:TonB family protein [Gammaproteobacteria bacterium]MBQ0774317.1 TonB family protein [Gammaproteobacteria bacterium]